MEDFNINLTQSQDNTSGRKFLTFLSLYALFPLINIQTRVNAKSSTLIDNIITNVAECKFESGVLYTDISDHMPIFCARNKENVPHKKIDNKTITHTRVYSDQNINCLIKDLAKETWVEVYEENNDANTAYDAFYEKFKQYYEKNLPVVEKIHKDINSRKPWITKGIMKSIHKKNLLFKRHIQNPNNISFFNKFKKYRNRLNSVIRLSRKKYFSQRLNEVTGNVKQTWEVLNSILGKKGESVYPKDLTYENDHSTDPKEIVNILNRYFVEIGPKLSRSIPQSTSFPQENLFPRNKHSFFFKPIDSSVIINIVRNLKCSKACGHDGLNSYVLKKIIHFIVDPLCHIFNLSLSSSIFPQPLKLAKVIPVFKKGDSNQCNNYRPISILPCISKILERIVYDQLYNFLVKYSIIIPCQYGFRKLHSTDLAILDLYDKVSNALSNNQYVVGLFIDLTKAFDSLDHSILLRKLERYGVRGTPLEWFRNYLSNRKQYTEYNNHSSDIQNLQCGVPQGSILGPLLFLIYVNDIVHVSPILSFILFADDATLLYAHKNLAHIISVFNLELPKLIAWFQSNKLSLNIAKTDYIIFHTPNKSKYDINNYNIMIDDVKLERKTHVKFLGVLIDQHINWNSQYDLLKSKVSRIIGILYKIKQYLPTYALLLLYKSFILSYLSYGNIAWGSGNKKQLNSIFILQKRALRLCTNSHYLAKTNSIFRNHRLLKVKDINILQTAVFMFKLNKALVPNSFKQMFISNKQIHPYYTRTCNNFHLFNPRTLRAHKSIRHRGPDVWHSLSNKIKQCTSLHSLKTNLKKELIASYHCN